MKLSRKQIADAIIQEPTHYMVCEGCGSIAHLALIQTCPTCHGYRFDTDNERVVEQAILLGSRPAESTFDE